MAFTKITASGIGSTETVTLDGLSVINDGSFGGNVSVAGTLTYEDVTNIDSVGLITARAGVVVGSGITLSKDGDIFATGVTTATSFVGDGSQLTGVASTENIRTNTNATFLQNVNVSGTTTAAGNINVSGANITLGDSGGSSDDRLTFGAGTDLSIYHSGSHSYIQEEGTGSLYIDSNQLYIRQADSDTVLLQTTSGGVVQIKHNGNTKLETASGGVTVTGTVAATSYTGDGSSLTGISAISNAQQFRLAADQAGSSSAGTVLTNWEECDTDYQAIGSNWSQSSGVFSCSATGIYVCHWSLVINNTNTGDAMDPNIQISTNSGGAYTTRSRGWSHIANSYVNRTTIANQFMFDVSNTSTFRLRYRQSQDNDLASGTTIAGSSTESLTNIMFIRLGNT